MYSGQGWTWTNHRIQIRNFIGLLTRLRQIVSILLTGCRHTRTRRCTFLQPLTSQITLRSFHVLRAGLKTGLPLFPIYLPLLHHHVLHVVIRNVTLREHVRNLDHYQALGREKLIYSLGCCISSRISE